MISERLIDCMRHGACEGPSCLRGRTDVSLSKEGQRQVEQACASMTPALRVVTSPLGRCRTAAEQIANRWQVEMTVLDDLSEMDFGDWDGIPLAQLSQQYPDELAHFWRNPEEFSPPNAESLGEFKQRVDSAWQQILSFREPHVLVMTHAGVIKMWVAARLGVSRIQPEFMTTLRLDYANVARFRVTYIDDTPRESWIALEHFGGVNGIIDTQPAAISGSSCTLG